jgi:hypothetical protein
MAARRKTVKWVAMKDSINGIFIPGILSEIKHAVCFCDTM